MSGVILLPSDSLRVLDTAPDGPEGALKNLPSHRVYDNLEETLESLSEEEAASIQGLVSLLSQPIGEDVFHRLPNLRVVANYAVGYNNIDLAAAKERGVAVCNTPGVLTDATADLTMALLLACSRRILEADRFTREGKFTGWQADLFLGLDLNGARLGIIGMGRIGTAVAERARAFGLQIGYHNRNRLPHKEEQKLGADYMPLERLIAESDIISLHCPLTPETAGLMNRERLQAMKPGAIFINTARGTMMDEQALADLLKSGHLAAAGLDVFEKEPVVNPDLFELPQAVLLPHIGSAGRTTRLKMVHMNLESLAAAIKETSIPWLVQ